MPRAPGQSKNLPVKVRRHPIPEPVVDYRLGLKSLGEPKLLMVIL